MNAFTGVLAAAVAAKVTNRNFLSLAQGHLSSFGVACKAMTVSQNASPLPAGLSHLNFSHKLSLFINDLELKRK